MARYEQLFKVLAIGGVDLNRFSMIQIVGEPYIEDKDGWLSWKGEYFTADYTSFMFQVKRKLLKYGFTGDVLPGLPWYYECGFHYTGWKWPNLKEHKNQESTFYARAFPFVCEDPYQSLDELMDFFEYLSGIAEYYGHKVIIPEFQIDVKGVSMEEGMRQIAALPGTVEKRFPNVKAYLYPYAFINGQHIEVF